MTDKYAQICWNSLHWLNYGGYGAHEILARYESLVRQLRAVVEVVL